jgi:hypothetical protein
MNSGKLVIGGQFADKRGHFFVIDVAIELELLELLGRNILDSCKAESHPIVSLKIFSHSSKDILHKNSFNRYDGHDVWFIVT